MTEYIICRCKICKIIFSLKLKNNKVLRCPMEHVLTLDTEIEVFPFDNHNVNDTKGEG